MNQVLAHDCFPGNTSVINCSSFFFLRLIWERYTSTAVARWFRAWTQTPTTLFLLLPHFHSPRGAFLAARCSPGTRPWRLQDPDQFIKHPSPHVTECWGLTELVVTAALNNPSLQCPHAKGTLSGNNSVPSQGFITYWLTQTELAGDQSVETERQTFGVW